MHWIDPAYLPETKGTFDRFLINSHGHADGLFLTDGKEVHFPPHMGKAITAAMKAGDTVKIRGVRPRDADMVAAVSIQIGEAGPIIDHGPPNEEHDEKKRDHGRDEKTAKPESPKSADTEGVIRHVLHGPRGEKRGALLDNGTIVRIPPHVAAALRVKLSPEHRFAARGPSLTNAFGTVIDARAIGVALSALHALEPNRGEERLARKHQKNDDES